MNSPVHVAASCPEAFRRVVKQRDVNTAVFGLVGGVLGVAAEANWTPEEMIARLPADQARLLAHEVPFATHAGARRRAHLLIWWMPAAAHGHEAAYGSAFEVLRELCGGPVHLIARTSEHLAYPRLVALAG
ncbi:hypothetical protein KPP03845_100013 [Streptomyces xanthophaeus]|uniref:hypothetical protein n=1 Tax=Streptomyces xanthophaeus TaxID=67385 RepID=UPI00233E5F1B|nr:hypothetical protein [Streptomyces xanthophaeus]WCD83694.1 hypothetical protein KPP03845_100013 [Streptomyces xanthophaeus]